MNLELLISIYRHKPFWIRALWISLSIIFVIGGYWYFGPLTNLEDERVVAQDMRDQARAKYEKAKNESRNLPRLEKELADTDTKLKEAKRKLPDEFIMDKVLQKTAMIAEDIGVVLQVFDPDKGAISTTAFKYMELPIQLELYGTYSEIASFFDRLAHLELLIHLRDIALRRDQADGKKKSSQGQASQHVDPMLLPRDKSANLRLNASAKMIIYRGLSPEEAQQAGGGDSKLPPSPPAPRKPKKAVVTTNDNF